MSLNIEYVFNLIPKTIKMITIEWTKMTMICLKLKELGDICPLTSYIEIISLVSKALKQYKKVTSQALEARV